MVPLNVDCSVPSVYRTFVKEAPYVSELDEKMSVTESKVVYGLHRVEIHRGSRRVHGIFLFQEALKISSKGIGVYGVLLYCVSDDRNMRVMLVINHISECFDWKQLELQYQHEYNNISTSIGLTENPMVNFSGVVGTPLLVLGTDFSYDTPVTSPNAMLE
ncbi:uncharacterized protein LOC113280667 [Papaver somniferum]|uniref:uncharacterized protein LOC113280667 n=1 Tax=Papaver somniferum TaxID=3469 RepID=UPI000E6FAD3C|nr:uncharacterized protein LOC113280667 [Papaver somniferum]